MRHPPTKSKTHRGGDPGRPRAICTVGPRCASELGAPYHKSFFQHSSLFEILQQRGNRLIHLFAQLGVALLQIAMSIPCSSASATPTVIDLDKSHALFYKPSRAQAKLAKWPSLLLVESVEFLSRAILFFKPKYLRNRQLHAERQLVGLDSCLHHRIAGILHTSQAIEVRQQRKLTLLLLR